MAGLAGKEFTIDITDPAESISRASQRIHVNTDILKQAKVYAGDVVAITSSEASKVGWFF